MYFWVFLHFFDEEPLVCKGIYIIKMKIKNKN